MATNQAFNAVLQSLIRNASKGLGRSGDDLLRAGQRVVQQASKGGPRVTTGGLGSRRGASAAVTSASDGASMGRVPITGDPSLVSRARNATSNITPGGLLKGTALGAGAGVGGLLGYNALDRYVFGGGLPGGITPEQVTAQVAASNSNNGADGSGTGTDSGSGEGNRPPAYYPDQIISDQSLNDLINLERQKASWRQAQTEKLNSPEYLDALAARNIRQQQAINQPFLDSMERRTMENSRRQESVARINAWKEVEKQTIVANTSIAQSLASIAYQAGTPNANVLKATAPALTAGAGSFRAGQSVI